MESRKPADDPSTSFEVSPVRSSYYKYNDLTPKRMERIFSLADNRGRVDLLYRLYDDMENNDLRYAGILNQLRSTIARMPVRVQKADYRTERERQIAEDYRDYAETVLNNLDTHNLVQDLVEPYIRGAALYKIDWQMDDLPFNRAMHFPSDIKIIDGKHIREDQSNLSTTFGELMVRTEEERGGLPISELPFDNHLFLERRDGKNRYSQIGVARKVAPWYLALRYIKTWWVQYIENYGQPLRIGKYPRTSKKSSRNKMKKFLQKLGKDGYGLFPSGMDVDLLDVNQSGRLNVHKEFVNLAHQEYSIAILGQAGTTGENSSGYAETVELNGIRMDILQNIAEIVRKGATNIIKKGLKLNYGDQYRKHLLPEARPILLNDRNAQQRAKAAQTVSNMGVPVPVNHIYERILGTESPSEGENVVLGRKVQEVDGELKDLEMPQRQQNNPSQDESGSNTGDNSVSTNPNQDDGTVD